MLNRKFMTESARITDAYAQMYARRGVNESSHEGNGNLLRSLRGQLPIDGTGSPRTGSKLGVRKVLPFEKRDSNNCCGHSVPMKKNRQFEKITNDWRSNGGIEFSAMLKDKLNPRKVLPFEKRDDRPTSIGRISNIKNVSVVNGVRESISDDFEDIEDTEDISCDGCDKRDEVLDLVLSTFEQIYDNLSDDDKETVDEVKVEIESVLNPEDDDEDEEDVDGDFEDEEIGESVVNEAGGRRGLVAPVGGAVLGGLSGLVPDENGERHVGRNAAIGAGMATAPGVTKKGGKMVAKASKNVTKAAKGLKKSAKTINLTKKELAKFKNAYSKALKSIKAKNPSMPIGEMKEKAIDEALKVTPPVLHQLIRKNIIPYILSAGAASYLTKKAWDSVVGDEDNKNTKPKKGDTESIKPEFTNDAIRTEIDRQLSERQAAAAKAAEKAGVKLDYNTEDIKFDKMGIPINPDLRRKYYENLRAEMERENINSGSRRGAIDQLAEAPGKIIGGVISSVAKGGEDLLSTPSAIVKNSGRNIRATGYGLDDETGNEEYRLKMQREHEREMMRMKREEEQARLEAEQKRREQAEKLQQRQTDAISSDTQTYTVKDNQGGDNKVVRTSDSLTVTGPKWKEKSNGTEETK